MSDFMEKDTRLAKEYPTDAKVLYECASGYDLLGEERAAAPYYERSLDGKLNETDRRGAYTGLGSTYRTLGEYEKAKLVLEKGMDEFPDDEALRTFHAICLYNLGHSEKAVEQLIGSLLDTSTDPHIHMYKGALEYYRHRLNQVWEG